MSTIDDPSKDRRELRRTAAIVVGMRGASDVVLDVGGAHVQALIPGSLRSSIDIGDRVWCDRDADGRVVAWGLDDGSAIGRPS